MVPVSLTIASYGRVPLLREQAVVDMCMRCLRWAVTKHSMRVYAYCFMPNHLHLLVQGACAESFTPDFVHDFKGKSGLLFERARNRPLRQDGFHDRILRTWDALLDVAQYIAMNPVRAGIVRQAADWPFLGSFIWERNALVEP